MLLVQTTLYLQSIYSYKSKQLLRWAFKKIYYSPRLGVSRSATSVVINLSEEKQWQIKAFKCSYFLHTSQRIDVSPCCATNYPQREKQLTSDSWMWGIHSLWRRHTQTDRLVWNSVNLTAPSTHRARFLPHWCNADTLGEYSSRAIFNAFFLVLWRGPAANSITDGFYTSATRLLDAHACGIQ